MHGYPPDKTEKAVETVIKQAELLAADWAREIRGCQIPSVRRKTLT